MEQATIWYIIRRKNIIQKNFNIDNLTFGVDIRGKVK